METVKIAGVECRVDKLDSSTYESLYNTAIGAMCWQGVKNASKEIDKSLRSHGFKPTKTSSQQITTDNSDKNRGASKKGNTRKPRANSKSSKK